VSKNQLIRIGVLTQLLVASVICGNLHAQGICIPKPLTVHAVKGTVLFEVAGRSEPLSDVTVEVSPYGYKEPPLAKVITPATGRFDLTVRPGRYYLDVQHAAIIGMRVEIRVQPLKKGGEPKDVEFVLRNDPARACGGGTVSLGKVR
jgi:hypothetical protein